MMLRLFALLLAATLGLATAAQAQDQDPIARGKYLAILGDCAGCHSTPHGEAFAGGLPFTAPFGTLYSTNITPDKETGLGNWSGDDFYRALRDGIAPGGKHLYPAFPYIYFTHLDRSDTDALFAYLKTLTPVHAPPNPNDLLFPFNIRAVMTFWNWLYLDKTPFRADPAKSAAWNRGHDLVNGLGHCAACHTPKDVMFGDEKNHALTGAVLENWYAANLTGGAIDGLGKWSTADVATYLATGRNHFATAAGTMLEKVTSSTSRMTDTDRAAIATYLKSLPPQPLVSSEQRRPEVIARGRGVYLAQCQACHAENGQPRDGTASANYPSLAGDTLVMGRDTTTVLRIILTGGTAPPLANKPPIKPMPAFARLDDGMIADVATYIRNAWGNQAPPVDATMVHNLRQALKN